MREDCPVHRNRLHFWTVAINCQIVPRFAAKQGVEQLIIPALSEIGDMMRTVDAICDASLAAAAIDVDRTAAHDVAADAIVGGSYFKLPARVLERPRERLPDLSASAPSFPLSLRAGNPLPWRGVLASADDHLSQL